MEAEAHACAMETAPQQDFGLGIPSPDTAHIERAPLSGL